MNSTSPNIFDYATKELSQDAFFTWLIKWADKEYAGLPMHEAGIGFLRLLMNDETYQCDKVKTSNQWKKVDIVATIDKKDFIVIEDKTNSFRHSQQLEKYAIEAKTHCKNKKLNPPTLIYLKTGNEDERNFPTIESLGYTVITRGEILQMLKKFSSIENEIFQDFLNYLDKIEQDTQLGYIDLEVLKTNLRATEGLFMALSKKMTHNDYYWDLYRGGQLPLFRYNTVKVEDYRLKIFVDTKAPGVFVKIRTSNPSIKKNKAIFKALRELTPEHLSISWRKGSKSGKEAILCQVDSPFHPTDSNKLDLNYLTRTLETLEQIILKYKKQTTASSIQEAQA
ncbi:PD-(D/E)XK nuclease family protein [Owenweeksia hongkongensis]|uniref:PD-(D/E)XK nuclease family protein n=1 Tax=Owenweeksia hongkongensis TaxID=253245 RepID=UPI003A94CB8B